MLCKSKVNLGVTPTPNLGPALLVSVNFNNELAPKAPLLLNCICLSLPAGSAVEPPVLVAVGKANSVNLS